MVFCPKLQFGVSVIQLYYCEFYAALVVAQLMTWYIGFRYQIGYLDSFSNLDATCSLLILVATCTCKYSELLLLIGRSGEDIAIFSTLANTVLLGNMSWDTDLRYFRIADRRRDTHVDIRGFIKAEQILR